MTLMSGKVYSDAGTPSNATGENGDIFMQLDGLKTTYRKEGGAWTPIGNQLGTIPEFLKGIGVPSNAVGEDGQYYREVNTEAIYQKDAGAWTNIGSWTSLETQQLLQSNGIGADLATTNHVSNIDTFIEAGAEGYFDSATTGTKPHTYGVVKVTKASTELHQSSQTSTNKVATRVSGDTGTSWSVWRITANQDGDATRKFKALAGTAADDVAVVGQLPSGFSMQNFTASGSFTVPAGVTRILVGVRSGSTANGALSAGSFGGENYCFQSKTYQAETSWFWVSVAPAEVINYTVGAGQVLNFVSCGSNDWCVHEATPAGISTFKTAESIRPLTFYGITVGGYAAPSNLGHRVDNNAFEDRRFRGIRLTASFAGNNEVNTLTAGGVGSITLIY